VERPCQRTAKRRVGELPVWNVKNVYSETNLTVQTVLDWFIAVWCSSRGKRGGGEDPKNRSCGIGVRERDRKRQNQTLLSNLHLRSVFLHTDA
jgi:hypothetical protein